MDFLKMLINVCIIEVGDVLGAIPCESMTCYIL